MASADDLNALTIALSSWEIAGYASLIAVAVGCAGEATHEFTSWFKRKSWWKANGGKASALLLIAALASELIIQIKTNSLSGQIIALLNDKAAFATEQAATLGVTVDNLGNVVRRKTQDADTAIAALNAATARADEKISAVQQQQAQRHLKDSEKQALIALSPFGGQKVEVFCHAGDDEARVYRDDFVSVFEAAKWDHNGDKGLGIALRNQPFFGVAVAVPSPNGIAETTPSAIALVGILTNLNLLNEKATVNTDTSLQTGIVRLYVGQKRPPPK